MKGLAGYPLAGAGEATALTLADLVTQDRGQPWMISVPAWGGLWYLPRSPDLDVDGYDPSNGGGTS